VSCNGQIEKDAWLTVTIPARIDNGGVLRVDGKGMRRLVARREI